MPKFCLAGLLQPVWTSAIFTPQDFGCVFVALVALMFSTPPTRPEQPKRQESGRSATVQSNARVESWLLYKENELP
jgi:hypothetical protein